MVLDNYINEIWKSIYTLIKDNFTSYDVDIKPINSTELLKPTILILYPRVSKLGQKLSYNDEQNKRFRIEIYVLCDNSTGDGLLASSKIAGEIDSWIEHNQHLFSKQRLHMAQIITSEAIDYRYFGNEKITGYNCVLEGRVVI